MASNTVIDRVKTELQQYPPFNQLDTETLVTLSGKVVIKYYEEGEIIFNKGDQPKPFSFVVIKGSVNLYDNVDGLDVLVDVCDEGDIFGVRLLLASDNYYVTAKVAEESLIYALPADYFKSLIETQPKLALFFAAEFASGMPEREYSLSHALSARKAFAENPCGALSIENDTLLVKPIRNVITCPPDVTIHQAAKIMAEHNIGSIIIATENRLPLGIITDTDLRKKVVAVAENVKTNPVTTIMSSPVYTIEDGKTVADMVMMMMKTKLRHFCITEDGTPNTSIVGVISEHDVVTSEGNNPAVLLKEILQCKYQEGLPPERDKAETLLMSYLQQEVAVHFIASVITQINDAIIQKAMEFSLRDLEKEGLTPPVPFCWLSLGSEGRKEQMLRTDQDNALLYAEPEPGTEKETQAFFLKLGEKVTGILMQCGFKKCPADVMASNPKWCQPLSGWMSYFSSWIISPEPKALMHATIFFDFRPVYGDFSLADQLKTFLNEEIAENRGFISFLAINALQNPPPLSFFRSFIVESSGKHANEFDIKARTMMPLADAARVLCYELKVPEYLSTVERYEKIASLEPFLKDLATEAATAYEILIRKRAANGLKNKSSGRYINPNSLSKLDRQTLRNIFKTIERVQDTIKLRYQLDYFRQ